jgi:dTDP-4-amino-4,6-dideoxygalactose transaminase
VRESFLPFCPPQIGEEEIAEVVDSLRSGWITTGPKAKQLEADFQAYVGAPAALAVNSGTAALHLALATLPVGPGDEVITTAHTFVATVNAIEHTGAHPVLVDVEPDTLNMAPELVAAAITPRTKAVLPVHYAGHPVDMDPLYDLAQSHGLTVVEDAAHAVAATYRGRRIGDGANPVAWSFYATKNMTTAEGGMLTGPPEFIERAHVASLHGMSKDAWKRFGKGGSWYWEVVTAGFKYNMPDVLAAIGLCQLRKLAGFQQRRAEVVAAYDAAFADEEALQTPVTRAEVGSAWHLYVLRLHPDRLSIGRDQFVQELTNRNIGVSVHWPPIHIQPYYAQKYGYQPMDFPVCYTNYERMLSLPLHAGLSDHDVADVVAAVRDVVSEFRR